MDYGNSEHAKAFEAALLEKIHVDDPASRSIVRKLAELDDQIEECMTRLKAEGQFILDRFEKPKEHPACKRLIALYNEFGKFYRLLGLDQAPESQGKLF